MRNYFKTFALLLLMAVCSMGAQAATVNDLVAIDYDYVFIADDVTSNGTVALTAAEIYAEDHILAAGYQGNTVNTGKGISSFAGGTHLNCLRIKGTQNALAFAVSGACEVTFTCRRLIIADLSSARFCRMTLPQRATKNKRLILPFGTSLCLQQVSII